MECRERAMGEYRWMRERGESKEGARMGVELDRAKREQERLVENVAKGEEWKCVCGNEVVDSFACPVCGLTVIGSDMKRVERKQHTSECEMWLQPEPDWEEDLCTCGLTTPRAEESKGLGHGVGDQYAGGREDEGGGGSSRARKEVSGYTHGGPSAPSDEDSGGTYMLGIVIVATITAVVFFCLGLGLGRVVYGI